MGMDKAGSKAGGFFHLFDWNRKSRKKLFASGTISPAGSKQRANFSAPAPKFQIEDDDVVAISSVKGSDYSCASSITDEDGHGARAPGVVARLMGLDTLPGGGVSENHSTPFDSRSFQEKCHPKRSLDHRGEEDLNRSECFYRKTMEMRCQKTPSSPIERFQREMLPPRSARSCSINQYKLLSPIKNPRYFSGRDAAHIMEAAAKILEPGPTVTAKSTASCLSVRAHDAKENIALCQRASKLSEARREASTRTVSLAVQAKVNVKKREGSNASSSSTSSVFKEAEDSKNQRGCKIKPRRKASPSPSPAAPAPAPPGVLKQNNQKQNGPQKKDSPLGTKTLARRASSGDAPSTGRSRIKVPKNRERKEDLQKDTISSGVRKKRPIDWSSQTGKKRIQSSFAIDEHKKWDEEDVKGSDTDVVSFTFTSPMSKPSPEKDDGRMFAALGLNLLSGDALSINLEQKLRELTGRIESSRGGEAGSLLTSSSFVFPAADSRNPNNSQASPPEKVEHRSPISTLEAAFSGESDSSNGNKILSSSREEDAPDVRDSASSSFKVAVKEPPAAPMPVVGLSPATRRREAEYVKAILRNTDVELSSSLNPLLFDRLEKEEEFPSKVCKLRRKALFDCVGEFLDSRRRRHFCAGYRAWAMGAAAAAGGADRLGAEAHREISRWEDMGDWMVEDLVGKDMAGWVDFETEAFEAGAELEEQILASIVDDALADILIM